MDPVPSQSVRWIDMRKKVERSTRGQRRLNQMTPSDLCAAGQQRRVVLVRQTFCNPPKTVVVSARGSKCPIGSESV